jgi:hypothetical protein
VKLALIATFILATVVSAYADTCCCPNNVKQCITCTNHCFMNSNCVGACSPSDARGKTSFERLKALLAKSQEEKKLRAACGEPGDECKFDSDCCSNRCLDMGTLGKGCSF